MRIKVTVILAFILAGLINAQSVKDKVCLENTEQFSIASKYVTGENYIIQVGLPIGYSPEKKSYPVLYVLDGDKSFGMTKEIADWLMWSNEIKDIIIVGISYGKGTDIWWKKEQEIIHIAMILSLQKAGLKVLVEQTTFSNL